MADLQAELDTIAWRVLSDLLRPDGAFGNLPPEGLRRLIGLRLATEAQEANVAPEALAEAFDRALEELTGAGRPARHADPDDAAGDDPIQTIDDL